MFLETTLDYEFNILYLFEVIQVKRVYFSIFLQ